MSFFLLGLVSACKDSRAVANKQLHPLEERFDPASQPYAFVLPNLKPVEGAGLRAEECGACHQTIYRDWKGSTHARALRDAQFQAELAKPDSPRWLCLNCHIPVSNQRSELLLGLQDGDVLRPVFEKNPAFDKKMQAEGVSCATCHIRSDEKGESFIYGPNGSTEAPHPVRQNREFLHNICERCHNPQGEAVTPNLTCWFHTTEEMRSARKHPKEPLLRENNCVTCHMPARPGHLADAFTHLPKRALNHHFWTGGGIPKRYEDYNSLLKRGYVSGLEVELRLPESIQWGKINSVGVLLANTKAGHDLPTGDPERFLLVLLRVLDGQGREVALHSYRIGQTWQWNPAKKIADNRLRYKERRLWKPKLLFSSQRMKRLELHVIGLKQTRANFEHMKQMAPHVSAELFSEAASHLKKAEYYYPVATWLYREDRSLSNLRKKKVWTRRELLKLSEAQRRIPADKRLYWRAQK